MPGAEARASQPVGRWVVASLLQCVERGELGPQAALGFVPTLSMGWLEQVVIETANVHYRCRGSLAEVSEDVHY